MGDGDRQGRFAVIRRVGETGSTNADLVAEVRAGDRSPRVLVADHQRAGRGRLDRRWESPPGASLLASVVVAPPDDPAHLGLITPALALAALDAVHAHGVSATVKWPNDVLVEEGPAPGKLAGILAEAVTDGGVVVAVVVGIGLNLTWPSDVGVGPPGATSMLMATGEVPNRDELLDDVLAGFADRLATPHAVRAELRRRCGTLGRSVRVDLADGSSIVGVASDLDGEGRLVLVVDGTERVVGSGDVVHLRPAGS